MGTENSDFQEHGVEYAKIADFQPGLYTSLCLRNIYICAYI